jgi:hypothetical protein
VRAIDVFRYPEFHLGPPEHPATIGISYHSQVSDPRHEPIAR